MELPAIENVYYVTQSSGLSEIWGIPIQVFTGLLSTFVTLSVFGLGLVGQYLTNRRREIKKLKAYKSFLSSNLKEIKDMLIRQENGYRKYAQDMSELPTTTALNITKFNERFNFLDSIDKKESIYLFNRWSVDGENNVIALLKVFAVVSEIEFGLEFIRTRDNNEYKELAKEFPRIMGQYNKHIMTLQRGSKAFGLTDDKAIYILGRNSEFINLKDSSKLKDFISIVIEPILDNQNLMIEGIKSDSQLFMDFWFNLNELKKIILKVIQLKEETITFYEKAIKNLETLQKGLEDLAHVVEIIQIKKQIGFR